LHSAGGLGHLEHGFDFVFEGKVEGLGREVSDDVGQVASPEGHDAFGFEGSRGAVDDAGVGLVESALFDHLILVLDEEFDSLDGRGGGLGDTGGDTRQEKVLGEAKIGHFCKYGFVVCQRRRKFNGSVSST